MWTQGRIAPNGEIQRSPRPVLGLGIQACSWALLSEGEEAERARPPLPRSTAPTSTPGSPNPAPAEAIAEFLRSARCGLASTCLPATSATTPSSYREGRVGI